MKGEWEMTDVHLYKSNMEINTTYIAQQRHTYAILVIYT